MESEKTSLPLSTVIEAVLVWPRLRAFMFNAVLARLLASDDGRFPPFLNLEAVPAYDESETARGMAEIVACQSVSGKFDDSFMAACRQQVLEDLVKELGFPPGSEEKDLPPEVVREVDRCVRIFSAIDNSRNTPDDMEIIRRIAEGFVGVAAMSSLSFREIVDDERWRRFLIQASFGREGLTAWYGAFAASLDADKLVATVAAGIVAASGIDLEEATGLVELDMPNYSDLGNGWRRRLAFIRQRYLEIAAAVVEEVCAPADAE
jgi:hypothetical protein